MAWKCFSCAKLGGRGELPMFKSLEGALTATHRMETRQLGYTASNGEARSVMFRKQRSSLAYEILVLEKQKFECLEVQVRDMGAALDAGLVKPRRGNDDGEIQFYMMQGSLDKAEQHMHMFDVFCFTTYISVDLIREDATSPNPSTPGVMKHYMLEDPGKQKFLEDVLKKNILYKGVWDTGVIMLTNPSLAAVIAFIQAKGAETVFKITELSYGRMHPELDHVGRDDSPLAAFWHGKALPQDMTKATITASIICEQSTKYRPDHLAMKGELASLQRRRQGLKDELAMLDMDIMHLESRLQVEEGRPGKQSEPAGSRDESEGPQVKKQRV